MAAWPESRPATEAGPARAPGADAGGEQVSRILAELAEAGQGDGVSLADLVAALGPRSHGAAMLVFALPCCVPMPPGIPTACGLAISLISLQLLAGRTSPWLPGRLLARRLPRPALLRLSARMGPLLRRVERLFRPRLAAMVESAAGRALAGVLGLALGLTLILPIPFVGNIPPGIAATLLALALIQRDGVALILALAAAGPAGALIALTGWGIVAGLSL